MKLIMKWSCRELNDGWVMIGVDVDLSGPGEGECMMGLRRAVHPFHFDEANHPVIAFSAVISEMDNRMRKAVGMGAPTHSGSRACAFGGESPFVFRAVTGIPDDVVALVVPQNYPAGVTLFDELPLAFAIKREP
ncbi:hypothetical protein HBO14_11190 [Pseudomonas sp. WS 5406]|uniref:hypothetical protein n=1 Tax=Pseudomonas sp. WS 5406 TaxID=2717498 RepID=UPI0014763513|nr:hypothetical protein [Pseudomonas sp. WS 5406]NMX27090.1 hypothetical protein [Pseudomonas sp. WS 5406]